MPVKIKNSQKVWLLSGISLLCVLSYLIKEKLQTKQEMASLRGQNFYPDDEQKPSTRLLLAKKLYEEARRQQDLENIDQSFASYNKALFLFEEEKDEKGALYCNLGILHLQVLLEEFSDIDQTASYCLEKFRELKNSHGESESLIFLGIAHHHRGEFHQAFDFFSQAIHIAKQQKFKEIESWALYAMGKSEHAKGNIQKAIVKLKEALNVATKIQHAVLQIWILKGLGSVFFTADDFTTAIEYFEKADKLAKLHSRKIEEAHVLRELAILEIKMGHYNQASISIQQSLVLFDQLKNKKNYNKTFRHLCILQDEMGKDDEARNCFKQASIKMEETPNKAEFIGFLISYGRFERRKCNYEEARKHFNAALEYAKQQKNLTKEGDIYFELATIERRSGSFVEARHHYNQAAAIARQTLNKKKLAKAMCGTGALEFFLNRYDEAESNFIKALEIAERQRSENLLAYIYLGIGSVKYVQGYYEEAKNNFSKSYDIYKKIQKKSGHAKALFRLGQVSVAQGNYDEALTLFDKALLLLQQAGRVEYQLRIFLEKGNIEFCRGNNERAREYFQKASSLNRKTSKYIDARSLEGLALIAAREGNTDLAKETFKKVIDTLRLIQERIALARNLKHLGLLEYNSGNTEESTKLLAEALILAQEVNDQQGQARILNTIGFIDISLGNNHKAQKCFEQSLLLSQKTGYRKGECQVYVNQAILASHLGDIKKAQWLFNIAQRIAFTLSEPVLNGKILLGISKLELNKGFFGRARSSAEQGMLLLKIANDKEGVTRAIRYLGDIENASNANEEVRHAYEKVFLQSIQINNSREKALALLCLGKISIERDEDTKRYFDQALDLFETIKSPYGKALALRSLAYNEMRWGSYKKAQEYLLKAAYIFQELRYKPQEIRTLIDLGNLHRKADHYDKARECYDEGLMIINSYSQNRYRIQNRKKWTHKLGGEDSLKDIEESLKTTNDESYDYLRAIIYYNYGKLELTLKNATQAIEYLENASALFEKADDILWLIKTLRKIGKAEVFQKNFTSAELIYRKALNFAQFRGNKFEEEEVLAELALLYGYKKDLDNAHKYYEQYKQLLQANTYDELRLNLLSATFYHLIDKNNLSQTFLKKALQNAHQLKKKKEEAEIYFKIASFEENPTERKKFIDKGNTIIEDIGCKVVNVT